MWPWGHLAVGYLVYTGWRRWRGGRPRAPEVFFLALGTLFPDLVDKPLAWTLGLLASGRSLGHSLLIAAVVLAVLWLLVTPRLGRPPIAAFAVGYLSHVVADLPVGKLLAGEIAHAHYLVWPLLPLPPYELEPSFLAHLLAYELGPYEVLQLGLFVVAGATWIRDGRPGWATVRDRLHGGR